MMAAEGSRCWLDQFPAAPRRVARDAIRRVNIKYLSLAWLCLRVGNMGEGGSVTGCASEP